MTDLTTPCPGPDPTQPDGLCGNTGPHIEQPDCPDPGLAIYVPVHCAKCSFPFTIDTRTNTVRVVDNAAGLADLALVQQADGSL